MAVRYSMRRVAASVMLGASTLLVASACVPEDPAAGPVPLDESTQAPGVDGNRNGVRDDIDKAIAQAPVSEEMRSYLTETARVDERVMRLDVAGDPAAAAAEAYEIASEANMLVSCVPTGLDPIGALQRAEDLRLLIANTDAREAQVAAFSKLIDGRAFPAPDCEVAP